MNRFSHCVRRLHLCLAVLVCVALWHPHKAIGRGSCPAKAAPAPAPAAAVKAQDPRVWAGVSASVPGATTNAMFSAGEVTRLVIGVALVNDSGAPIPFARAATRLVINGE